MPKKFSIQSPERSLGSQSHRPKFSFFNHLGRMLNQRLAVSALLVILGSSLAFTSPAQDSSARAFAPAQSTPAEPAVQAVLTQRKVVRAPDGREKFEDASTVKPGDVIEYQVVYTNLGAKPVTGLVADLPIPEGLAYQPRSAKPGELRVKAAAKDGVFAAEPLSRNVAGKAESVPYNDYRRLRWALGQLPAHGVATVTARAQVETVVPVLPAFPEKRPVDSSASSLQPNIR